MLNMAEKPTDWKVMVALDRKALANDIAKLAHILARQKVTVIISAVNEAEALKKAEERLQRYIGIPIIYVKSMYSKKMLT